MQNKKLLLALLIGGGFLIIGGWIFLYRSLTGSPKDLQADVGNTDPIAQDSGDVVDLPTTDNSIHKQDNTDTKDMIHEGVSLDEVSENSTGTLDPISIVVPPHIDPDALAKLRKEIYKTHNVLVEFDQAKTFQAYEETVSEQHGLATADMILLPSNRFESYIDRGTHIPTKQPLSPLFHPILQPLVDHETTTFIPFSLDPYITIYDENITLPNTITIGHLQQQLVPLVVKETHKIPISFGVSAGDLFLLAQSKQAYPEYRDLLEIIISEAAYTRNTYIIEYFLQAFGRDTRSLLTTARQAQDTDTACMTFPHICLLKQNDIAISFGRLSSLALGYRLFDREYSETYDITNFPVSSNHYPLTTRGFVINKKSEHLTSVSAWLRGYLEHAGFGNIPLWPYTLSAFNNVFKQQKIQLPYVDLLPYIDNFYIVSGDINHIQTIAENEKLQSMLAGEYSKIIYIKEQFGDN